MYCSTSDVRTTGTQLTSTAQVNPLTDLLLADIIERASRFFDKLCGVKPGYFESVYAPDWQSNHVYVAGDLVNPTTKNGHKYRVTTAGTSGSSEPVWPTSSAGTVTNGSVVFTENGPDADATEQTFYSDGGNFLSLPPYVPGSLNTTIGLPDGYTAQPFIEREGYLIRTDSNGLTYFGQNHGLYCGFYSGVPMVITAIWGFAETPAEVKLAVIELAINLFRETDPAGLKLTNLDGGVLREKIPPRVDEIARRYRRSETKAVFV